MNEKSAEGFEDVFFPLPADFRFKRPPVGGQGGSLCVTPRGELKSKRKSAKRSLLLIKISCCVTESKPEEHIYICCLLLSALM